MINVTREAFNFYEEIFSLHKNIENLNKRTITYAWKNFNILRMFIFTQMNQKFNVISNEIATRFFTKLDKLLLKIFLEE